MKSVEQVLQEPTPATVNYRTVNNKRDTLSNLIASETSKKSVATSSASEAPVGKLNWVNGVFIPVLLNIWGVIMFLRLGWVVGQAGLLAGTGIIVGANVVTGITALSLCAICTNGEVKGGGVYFLISRALGPVYGGLIGLLFFVAQAVAVSLYVVGFSEAVVDLIRTEGGDYFTGSEINDIRVIGIVTATILFLTSLIGIGWYAKTQTVLLVILIIAIASVFGGAFAPSIPNENENRLEGFVGFRELTADGELRNLYENYQVDPDNTAIGRQSIFSVFAVFFPAVTGIMAGANLSGDLDDASKAIPKGTLGAIVVTFISYVALLWFVGLTCLACVDPEVFAGNASISELSCDFKILNLTLLNDPDFTIPAAGLLYDRLIMTKVSLFSYLVYIGVFAATLSSALASLVGAPRILQSVANDKLFPFTWFNFFGKGRGAGNEPIRGYCLTFVITCGCVAIGKLDLIAPIITNFFMISYAFTNYACFRSSQIRAPNWRPSFKYYNKYLSLFGAVLCVVVMIAIDWLPALITLAFAAIVFFYLTTLNPDINWGEAGEAKKYSSALYALEKLQLSEKTHVKTFRPQFLVLTGDILSRIWLVKFVSLFQMGGGLMLCADVVSIKQARKIAAKKITFKDVESQSSSADESSQEASKLNELFKGTEEVKVKAEKEKWDINDSGIRTANELAEEYKIVTEKRQQGEKILNNKVLWGGRRCRGAFFDAVISPSLFAGFQQTLQLGGIGKMRPNAVVVGFKSDYLQRPVDEIGDYERMLRSALAVGLSLLVVRDDKMVFEIQMPSESLFPSLGKGIKISGNAEDDKSSSEQSSGLFNHDFKQEVKTGKDLVAEKKKEQEKQDFDTGASKSSLNFKERIDRYLEDDTEYMTRFEKSLPSAIPGDTIDVWWLADDGGLTMLLPQLLTQNPLFKNKKLRVMAVSNKFQDSEETSRLKKAELRMVHLLHKFRIKAETVAIEFDSSEALQAATSERFEKCMGTKISELEDIEKARTQYNLRLSEEIRKTSRAASVVFMILPIPETNLREKLHTTWLDMFSYDMPPTVMMRGNNENVLTFFC